MRTIRELRKEDITSLVEFFKDRHNERVDIRDDGSIYCTNCHVEWKGPLPPAPPTPQLKLVNGMWRITLPDDKWTMRKTVWGWKEGDTTVDCHFEVVLKGAEGKEHDC